MRTHICSSVAVAATLLSVYACSDGNSEEGARGEMPIPIVSALAVPGRGATVPFIEQEAENAVTNGTVLAMNRNAGTLAGEASGRRAVTLSGQGQYVEFTLTEPANSIDVRYSLPDSSAGTGIDAKLGLYIDGVKDRDLDVTSRYAWYYGSYPFTNRPSDGKAHHFYDETRALLGRTLPKGTKVKLQVGPGNDAPSYTIDLADFEQVAGPGTRPANSLSVTEYGATANDATDDANAFDAAVSAARSQGKEVWIPPGVFMIGHHITVNQVTIRGAGAWHSELRGNRAGIFGLGEPPSCDVGGTRGSTSSNVKLYDFAIIGEVKERVDCDQANGIGGALGGGSEVARLWIQHTKVGLWLDGPFDGLTVRDNRILDQTADGLNLHQGVSHVTVTNNFWRNLGDDGLAMWSEKDADHDNVFSYNTVIAPILANGIAIYGGYGNSATDNVIADNQDQGGGIHVANRFSSVPLSGTTTIARNTTVRCGVLDSNWNFGVGALWFDGRDAALNGTINVSDTDLVDNNYEGIQFIDNPANDVHFSNVRIQGAGTFALQLQANGKATFSNVVASKIGRAGMYNCMGSGAFTIVDQGGNSGWSTTYCGGWPTPVYDADNGGDAGTDSGTDSGSDSGPPTGNLALNRPVAASSSLGNYPASNAVDGNQSTYWESTNNVFPQTLTVDLGTNRSVSRVVLKLPTPNWGTRTQTLSVLGSTDNSNYTTLLSSRGVTFDPASSNTATLTFPASTQRYIRLHITANTGWPAGQCSEFEVYSQ
ncbi:discoidin domain-containing protein [Pendulispora brunnea]|uniref:Discoidin domain-containing protein n=1 Tax=Pendulispora brunnea TaxID=2905690 RepID=A0ABZ2K9W3_9BACT